ncbi:MAG TPA: hydroxymethylbilane synthase [Thermoanaerobaculia bacterium]|nr:hydroxymethylbilane synthase [Thermoanaerobaculia bacterium]
MKLRLGARGSALSLAQARLVTESLAGKAEIELVKVRTTGDRLSAAGSPIEWKGDFTRELDEALLDGRIDFAVHSLKDVPTEIPTALSIVAVPLREDPRDVLVTRSGKGFADLPGGARVGTASPRRKAQLLAARPDLEILDARGNVDTRLTRLAEGRFDAIVLARAGLARLGRVGEATEVLPESVVLPAVGQGALAIVARVGDSEITAVLASLDHAPSHRAIEAERSLLSALEAGCKAPVAALASVRDGSLRIRAGVFSFDGSRSLREEASGLTSEAAAVGKAAADALLSRGAGDLIAQAGK